MRQTEANTEAAADARLDEEEPVRIDMTDLSRRLDRANARAQAERDLQPIKDDEDIDVISILAAQLPPLHEEDDDDDVFSLADLDMLGEGGAA